MNLSEIPAYGSVLLLQGPAGPFFQHFAGFLKGRGAEVFKINFHGGDDLFFRKNAHHFRRPIAEFSEYLNKVLDVTNASAIFLFDDQRPLHELAIRIASSRGVDAWVFEDGYVTPGYVTLKQAWTTSGAGRPRVLAYENDVDAEKAGSETPPHVASWAGLQEVGYRVAYGAARALKKVCYWHYRHHSRFDVNELVSWVVSMGRKVFYRPADRLAQARLLDRNPWGYFLVPLQPFSGRASADLCQYDSATVFIEHVLMSFADHAPADSLLVFKHHPADRGHVSYDSFIRSRARVMKIHDRVRYVHEADASVLAAASKGVVLMSDQIGYRAARNGCAVKVMGTALYDVPDVTYQGELDDFWCANFRPDPKVTARWRLLLIAMTQVSGNFYDCAWCRGVCDLKELGTAAAVLARIRRFNR